MMALSRITQERTRLEPTRGGKEERGDGGPEEVAQVGMMMIMTMIIIIITVITIITITIIIIMEDRRKLPR